MIICKNLTKIYGEGRTQIVALRGLDLSLDRGEFLGIRGPSGSGKTTLIHILGCIDKPSAGSVVVNGIRLDDISEKEADRYRRDTVGMVFQFFNLIPNLSSSENVELPMALKGIARKERRMRAQDLLRIVDMDHLSSHRPDELSGGEKQRVAIAVSLANNPDLILADEPTGELDQSNTDLIVELFRSLNSELGTTIIIASHDESVIARTSKVVDLKDGTILSERNEIGTPI